MEKHCEKIRENAQSYFDGTLSAQSADNIEQHLKECHDCAWFFREYEKMNEILSKWRIPEISEEFEESVINAAKESGEKKNRSILRIFFNPFFAGSALLMVLVFSAAVYYFSIPVTIGMVKQTGYEESRPEIIKTGELIVAGPSSLEISLSDGSTLFLSKGATFKMEIFRHKEKLCMLEGEARAEIRKYPGQEFKVKTSNAEIRVLGTVFLVSATKMKTIVSVIEGSVAVKSKAEKALLTKGNIVVVLPRNKFITPVSAQDALKDQAGDVRVQAIRTLAEYRGKLEMLLVAGMLEDTDPAVRTEAAASLGYFGKDGIRPLLKALRDKNKFVRAEAASSLGRLKAMDAREPLRWMREDKDVDVRIAVALALQNLGEKPFDIPELFQQLDSKDSKLKIEALKLLGKIGGVSASAKVVEKLKDTDNDVKWFAIRAMENLKDAKTLTALMPLLKDPDEEVRKKAVQVLSNLYFSEAIPDVAALLSEPVSREVKFTAIRALGYLLTAYYRQDKEKQAEILIKYINDQDKLLKVSALFAYSRALGACPLLRQKVYEVSVKDGNKIMKEACSEILKNFYKQDFRFILRSIEISALGRLREKAVIPVLLTASKDWNPLTRKAAMEGFEYLNDKIYLSVLYERMKDHDPRVAEAAEEAIKTITE